jgi:tetratricopeptide (TPR) repeat protein
VLGFAYLTRVDIEQATAAFQRAIGLDQSAPMPRLGLGLALIRDGELQRGRAEIELAVILDPGNSLLRSYVGKAYYEEKRDKLAESQLEIARELDPFDPTPWLYDAIRKQSINRPVEALHDLEASIERNGNRAVYRSTLGLEQDAATRSAGLGRIYGDVGFEQLALLDGWKSVYADQRNYSGHRLLADTYSTLPRHEIARVNELFQSQLLQPLNVTPIQPQLAETNLFILDSAGPTDIAFNEFNPLFNRDRVTFQGSAAGGGNGTQGEDLVLAGIAGKLSYSVGQFHFETDGFRENNDLEQDVVNGFVQYQVSDKTSLLGELRSTEREQGDLRLLFDPQNFDPFRRDTEETDSMRFGVRHAFTPASELLGSIVYQNADLSNDALGVLSVVADLSIYTAEVQQLYRRDRWRLTSGLRLTDHEQDEVETVFGVPSSQQFSTDSRGAYVYAQFDAAPTVGVTLGASADRVNTRFFEREEFNPKLGVIWEPTDRTTVRATAFKTLALLAVSRQNIQPSLEPTQLVGYNQFYSGSDAESVERYGLSAEQKISEDLFAGVIVSRRIAEVPFLVQMSAPPFAFFETEAPVEEEAAEAYVYWMPAATLALSVRYQDERFENDPNFTPLGYIALESRRLPIELSYFHAKGFSASVSATHVDQEGTFAPGPPLFVPTDDADQFWVVDASVRYRLPNRRGLISLNVENLLDETFRYQDTDPENPRILPERFAVLRVTFAF